MAAPKDGHYTFYSDESRRLCEQAVDLARKRPVPSIDIIRANIRLLEEHMQAMSAAHPERLLRALRTREHLRGQLGEQIIAKAAAA